MSQILFPTLEHMFFEAFDKLIVEDFEFRNETRDQKRSVHAIVAERV